MKYDLRDTEYDYLKYWAIVKRYYKRKNNLKHGDLDMILFLYSEQYFSVTRFREFEELVMWDRTRFKRLKEEGYITTFREASPGIKAVYNCSTKLKRMVTSIYKTIVNKEIPENPTKNPMFKKDVCFTDKVHRNYIKKLNKELKKERIDEKKERFK